MTVSSFARASLALALAIASSSLSACAAYVGKDDPGVETTTQGLGTSGALDPSFGQGGKVIALGMSGDANGEHYAFSLARYTL